MRPGLPGDWEGMFWKMGACPVAQGMWANPWLGRAGLGWLTGTSEQNGISSAGQLNVRKQILVFADTVRGEGLTQKPPIIP